MLRFRLMRHHLLAVLSAAAVAAGAVSLTSEGLAAQAAKPAPRTGAAQNARTAEGTPDFTGMYDLATMTPVDRPVGVKSLILTDKEAAAMEAYERARQVKN